MISLQRKIESYGEVSFLPINNTQIILKTPAVNASLLCPGRKSQVSLTGTRLMQIPLNCALTSKKFNISKYVIHNLQQENIVEENNNWKVSYHASLEDSNGMENKDLLALIDDIYSLKEGEIEMEEKTLENSENLISDIFQKIYSWIGNWVHIVIVCVVVFACVLGLISLSYIYKNCFKN
jgi:hypothetical protein